MYIRYFYFFKSINQKIINLIDFNIFQEFFNLKLMILINYLLEKI